MRLALNQQSLQPIVQDAPAIFLMHSISSMLVKPYIHGYTWTPIDIPLERHLRIQH